MGCQAGLRELALGSVAASDDAAGLLPSAGRISDGHATVHAGWIDTITDTLGRGAEGVMRCPMDTSLHFDQAEPATSLLRRSSYGLNFMLSGQLAGYERFARLAQIERPHHTALLGELSETGTYAVSDHFHAELWAVSPLARAAEQIALLRHTLGEAGRGPGAAIGGTTASNWAFLDGHVETLGLAEVYELSPESARGNLIWTRNRLDPKVAR